MASPKSLTADWELCESLYRAGTMTLRQIADEVGCSHVAVADRAKKHGWTKSLKNKINEQAEQRVAKSMLLNKPPADSLTLTKRDKSLSQDEIDDEIVEANAEAIAKIRLGHRTDIARTRKLAIKMLAELEVQTDDNDDFARLAQIIESGDMSSMGKQFERALSLPGRVKTLKELGETLKVMVGLEREAFGIGEEATAAASSGLYESIAVGDTQ